MCVCVCSAINLHSTQLNEYLFAPIVNLFMFVHMVLCFVSMGECVFPLSLAAGFFSGLFVCYRCYLFKAARYICVIYVCVYASLSTLFLTADCRWAIKLSVCIKFVRFPKLKFTSAYDWNVLRLQIADRPTSPINSGHLQCLNFRREQALVFPWNLHTRAHTHTHAPIIHDGQICSFWHSVMSLCSIANQHSCTTINKIGTTWMLHGAYAAEYIDPCLICAFNTISKSGGIYT